MIMTKGTGDFVINGILIIDKPAGWTSHDVVAKLRGTLKHRRIGHGGTLDPMATGVLPIFIGRATRAAMYSENAEKEYIAGLTFGITTDTQDITGNVLQQTDTIPDISELKNILPQFLGIQKQIPPMYSAIKINGQRLYEIARRGGEIKREAREIEIKEIEILDDYDDNTSSVYVRIVCSKGTYIRTLCHDIGQALDSCATLSYLRRTRAGHFTIDMAHTLDDIREKTIFLPVDSVFMQYPEITLSDTDAQRVKNGAFRKLKDTKDGKYRFYSKNSEFLLFGEVRNNEITTSKSFYEV